MITNGKPDDPIAEAIDHLARELTAKLAISIRSEGGVLPTGATGTVGDRGTEQVIADAKAALDGHYDPKGSKY